jgi:serine phosphatase RsbU (regulator of sigma subunit)
VIALGWDHPYEMDDVERELLAELADVAAPAFRRASRTETDRDIASTLQSWLLPGRLPAIDGLQIATIYEAGKDEMKVGGDWYDVVEVHDGRAAIVVGDVVGHDIRAAAEMGQVRHVLASNLARSGDPADSLALTDRYFHRRASDTMATALVMVFDADRSNLQIASAGHLPPVIVEPGTAARTLDCGLGPPIGSGLGGYTVVDRPFTQQAIVIGFTDGIVEQRDRTIDESMVDFCSDVDLAISTNPTNRAIPILTDLVRARATDPAQRDDAAAVIIQAS